jgi:hypothetical protein
MQAAARTMWLPPVPGQAHGSALAADDHLPSEFLIPRLWAANTRYLSTVPDAVVQAEFPPPEADRHFGDYVEKHLGVAVEHFESAHEKLLRQGMLCELVFCSSIANEKQALSCAGTFLECAGAGGTFPMSSWGSAGPALPAGTGLGPRSAAPHQLLGGGEDGHGDGDTAAAALKLLYHLRKCVVHSARRVLTRHANVLDRETCASLSRPWKTVTWHALAPFFPTATHSLRSHAHVDAAAVSATASAADAATSAAPTPSKSLRALKSPHKEALRAVRAQVSHCHHAITPRAPPPPPPPPQLSLSYESSLIASLITTQELDALQAGPGAAAVVRCLFNELRGPHVSNEVTLSLASNLRFACNTLKNDGAVLEGSDLLVRLLRSAEVRRAAASPPSASCLLSSVTGLLTGTCARVPTSRPPPPGDTIPITPTTMTP